MGRIKTKFVKRTALSLYRLYKDQIKTDFNENKTIVMKYTDLESKKIKNIIAGYLTRLVRQQNNNIDLTRQK